MRKGGCKEKGNQFEREMLKELSFWLSDGERKDLLRRSMLSGGRTTKSLKEGELEYLEQAGDGALAAYHPRVASFLNIFLLEFKFYKDLRMDQFFWGSFAKEKSIVPFWRKLCKDALRIGRKPFLIAKQNAKSEVLVLNTDALYYFDKQLYYFEGEYEKCKKSMGRLATIFPGYLKDGREFDDLIHIFSLRTFLDSVKFDPS